MLVRNGWEIRRFGIARTGVDRQDAVQVVFERHQEDRRVMDDCRYSRGRSVVLGRWLEPSSYPVENKTKSDLTTRKICVPLVPVDNLSCVRGFPKQTSGPKNDGVLLGCTVFLKYRGGFRVTRVIYS